MYIQPNSTLRILQNVPLTKDYEHTLFFDTITQQRDYFLSKTKTGGAMDNTSYIKANVGKFRMEQRPEFFFDCNYLMFKNTNFENKWFYAFITEVEYVNNDVSLVSFEIDVLQTYHFNYQLNQSFIERHHVDHDVVGDNLVPENVWVGDYETDDIKSLYTFAETCVVIMATFDKDYKDIVGDKVTGLYGGVAYHAFKHSTTTQIGEINNFINGAVEANKKDGIVAIYLAPISMVMEYGDYVDGKPLKFSKTPLAYNPAIDIRNTDINSPWGDWKPKNKKLYTFPFNSLVISNLNGGERVYKYERFKSNPNGNAQFIVTGVVVPPVTTIIAPIGYKTGLEQPNYDEGLTLTGWSQLSYSTDSYKAWVAQAFPRIQQTGIGLGLSATASMMTGGASGMSAMLGPLGTAIAGVSLVSKVANTIVEGVEAYRNPNQHKGNINGNHLSSAIGIMEYVYSNRRITLENAKVIDDYFEKFGYAIKRVGRPNRKAREIWTYCKTVGCTISGNVPSDDIQKICSIYDKGLTWWRKPESVGSYMGTNSPIVG